VTIRVDAAARTGAVKDILYTPQSVRKFTGCPHGNGRRLFTSRPGCLISNQAAGARRS